MLLGLSAFPILSRNFFENAPSRKGKAAPSPESATAKTIGLKSRGGALTQRLLDQGLLTPKMLQQLQEEWLKVGQNDPPSSSVSLHIDLIFVFFL